MSALLRPPRIRPSAPEGEAERRWESSRFDALARAGGYIRDGRSFSCEPVESTDGWVFTAPVRGRR